MEFWFARRKSQRPELQIAIGVFDNGIQRDLSGRRQAGGDAGFQHKTCIIMRTGKCDCVNWRIAHSFTK